MYECRNEWICIAPFRSLLFKSSKGRKLMCKVSEFSYQLSLALAIELVKMKKTKWNERVSGFALAGSSLFFKASKHVFKNFLNNYVYVFNCDEISWFFDCLAGIWLGSIVHFLEGGSDGQSFCF